MLFPLLFAGASLAAAGKNRGPNSKTPFDNLVVFGDSWTDNGRLGYYINNGGNAPAPGTSHTVSNTTASGGPSWAQYAAWDASARLVDYAIGGATCSNKIISRYFSAIKKPFPSVLDDEIPSFKADVSSETLYPNRMPDNTVYALWIGTNDLGAGAFLTDSQAPGTTISDFVDCIWSVFDAIYKTGGRRFVLLNTGPLELAPLYAEPTNGGTGNSQFWGNKASYNVTAYSQKIKQYTTNVNTIFEYGVPFQTTIKSRWPKATFDLFDTHSLLSDIHQQPKKYLDAPYNVTGYYHVCSPTGSNCVDQKQLGGSSGFMWYDELHPSAKTEEIVADHFLDVVSGKSKYGTRYGGDSKPRH